MDERYGRGLGYRKIGKKYFSEILECSRNRFLNSMYLLHVSFLRIQKKPKHSIGVLFC